MIQVNNVFYPSIDDYISNNTKYPIMPLQELDEFTSNLNNGANKRFLIFLDLYDKYEKMRLENETTRLDTTKNKG